MSDTLPVRVSAQAWVLTSKPTVEVTPNHSDTARAVIDKLIRSRDVYAWAEYGSGGPRYSLCARFENRWRPAESREDTREVVEARLDGTKRLVDGRETPTSIPDRVINLLLRRRDREGASGRELPLAESITTRPIYVHESAQWIGAGYHEPTRTLIELDDLGAECFEHLAYASFEHADACEAIELLGRVCEGAAWSSGSSRSAWLATLVGASTRSLWGVADEQAGHAAPALILTTGPEGSGAGKSTLAAVIKDIAGGAEYADDDSGQELARTFAALIAERNPVIVVTEAREIKRHWTEPLTGGGTGTRALGTNKRITTPMRSVVIFPGIGVGFAEGGNRRRVIVAKLDRNADPSGAAARGGLTPEVYVRANAAKLWVAAQIVVIAYLHAGSPAVECRAELESFARWDLVRRAIVWAGGGDALASRDDADLDARDGALEDGRDLIELVTEAHARAGREWIKFKDLGRSRFTSGKAFGLAVERARFTDRRIGSKLDHHSHTRMYRVEQRIEGEWIAAATIDVDPRAAAEALRDLVQQPRPN